MIETKNTLKIFITKKFCLVILLAFLAVSNLTFAAEVICDSNDNKTALVIIDMQSYWFNRLGLDKNPRNEQKVKNVIAAQVEAINKAKEHNLQIIIIEYKQFGDTMSPIKDAVKGYGNIRSFRKEQDSMLADSNKERTDLVRYIKEYDIGNLIVVGVNGGACVAKTLVDALGANCRVLAYSNGIIDANYTKFVYPFVGLYEPMLREDGDNLCGKGCVGRFRETSSIGDVDKAMASGNENTLHLIKSEGPK